MKDCLFCKIAAREIPSRTVHEDARVFAFEDIAPKAPTHVLVVPKKHIGRLAEELALRAAAIALERGLSDYRIVINNGECAGQSVFHLHLHLLGGRPFSWPPG